MEAISYSDVQMLKHFIHGMAMTGGLNGDILSQFEYCISSGVLDDPYNPEYERCKWVIGVVRDMVKDLNKGGFRLYGSVEVEKILDTII